ncbi:MAG: hypothetical protein K2K75_01625 [Muribaculaceae bacterium]|nr:hypothetical protein [Muribaculaceae bacterium]
MRKISGGTLLCVFVFMAGLWSCSQKTHNVQTGIVPDELVAAIQNNIPVAEEYGEEEGAVQEPAWTYFERLSIAFDGDSTCIGMKSDLDFPEWYSGCFVNDRDRLTINVIGDTVEMRTMLNDLLGGNEFDLGVGVCNKTTQQQTLRLLREAMERSVTKQDVGFSSREDGTIEVTLTGDSIESVDRFKSEILDSPILRFKTVESLEIILL